MVEENFIQKVTFERREANSALCGKVLQAEGQVQRPYRRVSVAEEEWAWIRPGVERVRGEVVSQGYTF